MHPAKVPEKMPAVSLQAGFSEWQARRPRYGMPGCMSGGADE